MKQIVLKPKLSVGQKVKFLEAEYVVDRIDHHTNSYILKDKKDLQKFKVYFFEIKDIIEPPDEQDHLTQYNQRKEAVWDAVRLADHEYDEGNIPAVSRAEHIGHRALNALNGQEKKLEQVADAGKVVEEKDICNDCGNTKDEPCISKFKLRVGGVYRRRDGKVTQPLKLGDNPVWPWTDGQFFSCKSDGRQYANHDSPYDLIEEVQEVQPAQKEKDAVEQKPKSRTRVVVQREVEEFNCEVEPHPARQCDKCIPVQPSNPFKVGDKARSFFLSGAQETPREATGEVMEVEGDKIYIADNGFQWSAYHYKQCERVE